MFPAALKQEYYKRSITKTKPIICKHGGDGVGLH